MREYNDAIVLATESVLPTAEPARKGTVAFQSSVRARVFDKWVRAGVDGEAAARAANRFFSEDAWNRNKTQFYLTYRLLERLGQTNEAGEAKVNQQASIDLAGLIGAMYRTAHNAISAAGY